MTKVKDKGDDVFESEKLAELAGKENLNNCYYSTAYTTVNASDTLTTFVDAYTKEYGEAPNMFSALAYDAANLVLQALEKSAKTGAILQKAIADSDFEGLTGSFTFDKTHLPKKSVLVFNLVDGVQTEAISVDPNK
nr:ABC transporter substrate-binding protein [Holdemanella sp.]